MMCPSVILDSQIEILVEQRTYYKNVLTHNLRDWSSDEHETSTHNWIDYTSIRSKVP